MYISYYIFYFLFRLYIVILTILYYNNRYLCQRTGKWGRKNAVFSKRRWLLKFLMLRWWCAVLVLVEEVTPKKFRGSAVCPPTTTTKKNVVVCHVVAHWPARQAWDRMRNVNKELGYFWSWHGSGFFWMQMQCRLWVWYLLVKLRTD